MSKSLFFNGLPNSNYATGYDRNYNADDISDWLSVVFENGVVKGGLKVTATTGMILNIAIGRAAIKGKAFINPNIETKTVSTAPPSATRYDYIVLRYNNNLAVRDITIEYVVGNNSIPTVDRLTRSGNIYELMLCYIEVNAAVTSIAQSKITDTRGDENLCPYFTAVKGYQDYYDAIIQSYEDVYTMPSAGTRVVTGLAANLYNEHYSLITVYTNGIKEQETAYSVSTSGGYIVITFTSSKTAGAKITTDLGNFIDGEGLNTALNDYNNWTNAVSELQEANVYTYVCNGSNDNILLGNLVRAFLSGGSDYGSAKFNVIGTFGMTAAAGGSGTVSSPYQWFNFNIGGNRKVIVDFSSCGEINVPIPNGTSNIIFYSNNDLDIIGANVVAVNSSANTVVRVVGTNYGAIYFEKCRFIIGGYQDSVIAIRGTFKDCSGTVTNEFNNTYCFLLNNALSFVKIEGGEYYAYSNNSSSAIIGQSGSTAVAILYGVSAPTLSKAGYSQTHSIIQMTGGGYVNCTDLISQLTMSVISGSSNVRGTIPYSKRTVM